MQSKLRRIPTVIGTGREKTRLSERAPSRRESRWYRGHSFALGLSARGVFFFQAYRKRQDGEIWKMKSRSEKHFPEIWSD